MARRIHTPKTGPAAPIAAMEDGHLNNTCGTAHRAIMQLRAAASNGQNALEAALLGYNEVSPREAGEMIAEIMDEYALYFVEAYLRGLEGPRKMLMEIYNRQGAAQKLILPEIASGLVIDAD